MEVSVFTSSHNGGGASIFNVLAFLLNQKAPDFGPAINKLELQPHFDDVANLVPGGEFFFQDFKEKLSKLPTATFSRTNKNLTLKYRSDVCMGADLNGKADLLRDWNPVENESAKVLNAFCLELVQVLPVLQKTLKPKDDFDLSAFITFVQSKIDLLPATNEQVSDLYSVMVDEHVKPEKPALNFKPDAMTLDEFWSAISLTNIEALKQEDEESAMQPLVEQLKKLPVDKIESFYNHMSNALYALDTRKHCNAATQPQSDDSFLYLRCYVVAMGRKYYEDVLANPSKMPPDFAWCENLLSVAPNAWAEVTEDESMNFDLPCAEKSFETGSNEAAWVELV